MENRSSGNEKGDIPGEGAIRLGVSACLLGQKVRYDGGHKYDPFLVETLGRHVEWVAVCPEVESGLPAPREAMRLTGDPAAPRLVTRSTGIDHTDRMLRWADKRLAALARLDLCGFVFKSKSPSSGMQGVKVYGPSGAPSPKGTGLFAGAFMRRFPLLPVEDEGRLHNPDLRENFIERLFVFKRWREFEKRGGALNDLIAFHTDHKLLILSHSVRHYRALGALVAAGKKRSTEELHAEYRALLMEGLRLIATKKKHTNVLQHLLGYFKKQLTPDEKLEAVELIDSYYRGHVPLIVPVTLLKHFARNYDEPYLKRQYYLNPHPLELKLRNHA